VAGTTPFPRGCAGVTGEPGTENAEYEPYLVSDPAKPGHLTAAWIQDGGLGNVSATSSDGGVHWKRALVPGASHCTGGGPGGWVDPWLSRGADGTLYMVSLGADLPAVGFPYVNPRSEVVANRSTDGGATWSGATIVQPEDGPFYDKPSITADPRTPGQAYSVWSRRTGPGGSAGVTMLAKTTDGGRSWSTPAVIYDPGPFPQQWPHGNLITVLADGTLLDVFGLMNTSPFTASSGSATPDTEMAMRSRDGGQTWSVPVTIASVPSRLPGKSDSADQRLDGLPLPAVALDLKGTVYVAWHQNPSPASGSIRVSRSGDGGATWSTPAGPAIPPGQAFFPALAADSSGRLGLLWYDSRNDTPGDSHLMADAWFAYSRDQGRSWEQAHVAGPFDALSGPDFFGVARDLGDFIGLTPTSGGFDGVFTQAKPVAQKGPTAIFSAHVQLTGARTATQPPTRGLRLRLRVRPGSSRLGRRTRFVFRVTGSPAATGTRSKLRPIAGARVHVAGLVLRTTSRGLAALTITLHRRGRYRVTAAKPGFTSAQTTIRAFGRRCRDDDHDGDCDGPGQG